MAQYDLVFVQNNASSGVAFSEIKLGKPPDVGFSLTQHPNTGLLSWVQSINLITVYGQNDSGSYDALTKTGIYHIHPSATFTNGPKTDGGVLLVSVSPSGIYQLLQAFDMGSPKAAALFGRFFDSSNTETWSTWKEFGSGASETQWDDPDLFSAIRSEIDNKNIGLETWESPALDLTPDLKNRLIMMNPDERESQATVVIRSNSDAAFYQEPVFEEGSVFTIRSMNDVPIKLEFNAPTSVLGSDQVVYTKGYHHPGKHKSIQLICIGHDTWLVEGAVAEPPVVEEEEEGEPIRE